MKKWLVVIIIIVIVLAIALGIYYSTNKPSPNPSNCAKAGEVSFNDATGKTTQCCEGLTEVSGASLSQFNSECVPMPGVGTICSACGNSVCESWENKCNCPADCK